MLQTEAVKQATPTTERLIHAFWQGANEGAGLGADVLGGKGASLSAMTAAGLPVPPGFTLSVSCCKYYHEHGRRWPDRLEEELGTYLARLEKTTGLTFGQGANPLLVSVRSGAAKSMPGMMDTILNCGLHPGLADQVPSPALFWMVYAQFARQFATTVAHIPAAAFDEIAAQVGQPPQAHQRLAMAYIKLYEDHTGQRFPMTAWDALCQCINAVFESWNNERAIIYRKAHGLQNLQGTAVTVQSMFNSEVSGIAFTANPSKPLAEEIIIEGSFGLGEAIVSGEVTPDRFVLDRSSGKLKEAALGRKEHMTATLTQRTAGAPVDPTAACLSDAQISELAKIALDVEKYFGHPVDIEWGLCGGKFSLLQSRGIRGLDVARDTEIGRVEEIARLKQIAGTEGAKNGGKVWVIHNLSETLKAPTPLTWDIMRSFMSGNGGFGGMYKDFGYRPSRVVCEQGFLELISGRIYVDVDRAAQVFWEGLPYKYDHNAVLADPRILESAPVEFDANRADEKLLIRFPGTVLAMFRCWRTIKRARKNALDRFEKTILPPYRAYIAQQRSRSLTALSAEQVIAELNDRIQRVLSEFGKESLKPGFFGGCARAELEANLTQLMGDTDGPRLCQTLTSGLNGDTTFEQNSMLFDIARGKARLEDFLDRYGHRAVDEMELSKPRWREDAGYLHQIIDSQKTTANSPHALHQTNESRRQQAMLELPDKLIEFGGNFLREKIIALAEEAQTLLPYREIGKHYLLMGYELIRDALMELGRRWNLGSDVFFLHLDELPDYESNPGAFAGKIAQRKIRWQSAQRLDHPDVINSAQLDQLGLPRTLASSKLLKGLSLSAGLFQGTARIVNTPDQAQDLGDDCVLICPSTDPSWTALFTTIKGLVVERGGVLSHGAITARDFSIPAIACPDATRIIKNGATVRVDGDRGEIAIVKD